MEFWSRENIVSWLHNTVLSTAELYTKMVKVVNFMLSEFYRN